MKFLPILFTALLVCLVAPDNSLASDNQASRYAKSVQRPYEDVVEDVEFAISEYNFRLTGGNRIGAAIAERNEESFPKSEIIHFCNLEYAKKFLQADPDFLLHMPCKVVVYEQNNEIIVETLLLPEQDTRTQTLSTAVNNILRAIVDYATE